MSIAENIKNVRERVNAACLRAGRDPKEVTLISVSKTKPVSMLMEAYEAGERDFGENKVQEITEKRPQIPEDARFHMIGHLQTNKVGQVIDKAVLIHSCDSVHLAEKIEKEAAKRDMIANVLLEVNVAREESNVLRGCDPEPERDPGIPACLRKGDDDDRSKRRRRGRKSKIF